jgi:amino acid adenylation domain-containing protein
MSTVSRAGPKPSTTTRRAAPGAPRPKKALEPWHGDGLPRLSFAQQRLWLLAQIAGGEDSYNVPYALHLRGALDVPALERALNHLVARHAILRTRYTLVEGEPRQEVLPRLELTVERIDMRRLPEAQRQAQALEQAIALGQREFDLQQGPLLRANLWLLGEREHILLLVLHHSIIDEWSLEILNNELSLLYAGEVNGLPVDLPEPALQYADYAEWQREWLQGALLEEQLAYWKDKLVGAPQVLELPTDHPRPAVLSYCGAIRQREIAGGLPGQLRRLCRAERVTPYTALLAAFYALLYRYTGQSDVLVGTPVANRQSIETQGMPGFFLNTLALRGDLGGDPGYRALLQRVNETVLEALDYQDLPFEKLVEEIHPRREAGRQPLFQVMFVYQPPAKHLSLAGLEVETLRLDIRRAKFDLTLFVGEAPDALWVTAEYSTDLFEAATIDRLLEHYQRLLQAMLDDPGRPISACTLLTGTEIERFRQWNATQGAYPAHLCVHELVEAQVLRTPQAVAVESGERRLAYLELNEGANRLAHRLRQLGCGPGACVGLFLERSAEMMVAVLAVLKAGAACLPLDPGYPQARLAFMCAEAGARVVLTQRRLLAQWSEVTAESGPQPMNGMPGQVLCLDALADELPGMPAHNPAPAAAPDDPAYVLYTSGSTGRPKGVMMGHRPLVNLVSWQVTHFSGPPAARTLQWTSLNFDVAFQEILSTWSAGGTLVLIGEALRQDISRLAAHLRDQSIQRLFLPFVALQALAEAVSASGELPAGLEEVITAGEQLQITPQIAGLFAQLPGCRLHNQYGPTEAHVVSAFSLAGPPQDWPRLPPIGKPIANVQIHLLDRHAQPVPSGVVGEIYLGGDCLAQGYLRRPALSAERFVPDPFGRPGERLYRTGDLGRYLPDGNIQFLGRGDQQVKIRGYRVELAEIEVNLMETPGVRQAAVLVRRMENGEKRLAAYLALEPDAAAQAENLRSAVAGFLKSRLPDYMVPSTYVILVSLPLTPTGKVDRLALAEHDVLVARDVLIARDPALELSSNSQSYAPPRDDLEQQLCRIWEAVLGVQPVGVQEDFFELGGHSLLAVRLFTRIEHSLGQRLPLSTLFAAPTVAQLAEVLRSAQKPVDWSPLVSMQPEGSCPPFFCVHNFGGEVLNLHRLAQALGEEQPFYGLQARGLDGQQQPHITIPDMATYYLQAIQSVQPHGPYYLGGFCFGGIVAYEMACRLLARGETVRLVALIDAYAPNQAGHDPSAWQPRWMINFLRNLPVWWRDFWQLQQAYRKIVVIRRLKRISKAMARGLGRQAEMSAHDLIGDHAHVEGAPDYVRRLMELHMLALIDYSPPEYAGCVTLLRTQRLPLFTSYGPEVGWKGLAHGGVDLHIVPGAHHNILWPPYVNSLAEALRQALAAATQSK